MNADDACCIQGVVLDGLDNLERGGKWSDPRDPELVSSLEHFVDAITSKCGFNRLEGTVVFAPQSHQQMFFAQ